MSRSAKAIGMVGGLLAVACLIPCVASAAVIAGTNGGNSSIYANGDGAGDTITLDCVGGNPRWVGVLTYTNPVTCAGVTEVAVTGGGGNDAIDLHLVTAADFPNLASVTIDGGAAADQVTGTYIGDTVTGDSADTIFGGGGGDTITGGGNAFGGDGDDVIKNATNADGGPGSDLLSQDANASGGTGTDTFEFDLTTVNVLSLNISATDGGLGFSANGGPTTTIPLSSIEKSRLLLPGKSTNTVNGSGFSGSLEVVGKGGVENITGGPGDGIFLTGAGDDTVNGGAGFDYVDGGGGSDRINVRGGGVDRAVCGDDADTVQGDGADVIASDCESVDVPDTTAPDTTGLKGPKSVKAKKAAKFTFASSEAGSTFTCQLDKGAATACTSPFSTKVKKPGKHTLTVTATDAAGNADATPATVDFTVKKAKKKKKK